MLQNSSKTVLHQAVLLNSSLPGVVMVRSILELCDMQAGDSGAYSCVAGTEREVEDAAGFQVHVLTFPGEELLNL